MNSTTATDDGALELLASGKYRALCITNLVICSTSVILSAVMIMAMLLPLLFPKKRSQYSTYNLYLAYMAVPDLVANIFIVYLLVRYGQLMQGEDTADLDDESMSWTWMFDYPFVHSTFILCVASNLYVNAFLTFEIYQLLKNSKNLKRHAPPTVSKVTKQAIFSYGIGFALFLFDYLVAIETKRKQWIILYQAFTVVFVGCIPLSVLAFVCAMIYKQNLIRMTGAMYEGRLKVLIVFFARIVFVGLLFWLPSCIVYTVSWRLPEVNSTKILTFNIALIFSGLQAISSFIFSLTKPDTRKLIFDLSTCIYCLQCCGSDERGAKYETEYFDDPYLRSNLPTTRLFSPMTVMSKITSFRRKSSILWKSQDSLPKDQDESNDKIPDGAQHSRSGSHEQQNMDWKDEDTNSSDPQSESSSSNRVVEEV